MSSCIEFELPRPIVGSGARRELDEDRVPGLLTLLRAATELLSCKQMA